MSLGYAFQPTLDNSVALSHFSSLPFSHTHVRIISVLWQVQYDLSEESLRGLRRLGRGHSALYKNTELLSLKDRNSKASTSAMKTSVGCRSRNPWHPILISAAAPAPGFTGPTASVRPPVFWHPLSSPTTLTSPPMRRPQTAASVANIPSTNEAPVKRTRHT